MHTDIGVKIGHWYYANILVFQYVDSNKNKLMSWIFIIALFWVHLKKKNVNFFLGWFNFF